jgi:hypothetical protein
LLVIGVLLLVHALINLLVPGWLAEEGAMVGLVLPITTGGIALTVALLSRRRS